MRTNDLYVIDNFVATSALRVTYISIIAISRFRWNVDKEDDGKYVIRRTVLTSAEGHVRLQRLHRQCVPPEPSTLK